MCLGQMYVADARFTASIDAAGGAGTAAFVRKAIETHCEKAE
jgi:TipAS antibiotic-recognition domain.